MEKAWSPGGGPFVPPKVCRPEGEGGSSVKSGRRSSVWSLQFVLLSEGPGDPGGVAAHANHKVGSRDRLTRGPEAGLHMQIIKRGRTRLAKDPGRAVPHRKITRVGCGARLAQGPGKAVPQG